MNREQSIFTIATFTELTPDAVLALVRELAIRWPDRSLAQLAQKMQEHAQANDEDLESQRGSE